MEDWLIWFVSAVVLVVVEMFTTGFWMACLAVGCVAAGLVGLVPFAGVTLQTMAFAATSLASMIGLRTGVDALLGKTGVVLERIGPRSHQGRVKVEGEDWRGASLDDTVLEPGTRV